MRFHESYRIADKFLCLCNDPVIKNTIISEIFKYLYIKNLNRDLMLPEKLCYQINVVDVIYAQKIVTNNENLIHVKSIYPADLSIYVYVNNKRTFVINMQISTSQVIGVYEHY
jgi:hypothetical protein